MFNAKRHFGEVSGTGVAGARFYQDGQYYSVDYQYLFSDPGVEAPRGRKRRSMEEAEAEMQRRELARSKGEVIAESTGAAPPAPQAPQAPRPEEPPLPESKPQGEPQGEPPLTKEQQLHQLNVPRLQEMQLKVLKAQNEELPEGKRKQEKEIRADIIKGPGAKDKLVEWLVKATD